VFFLTVCPCKRKQFFLFQNHDIHVAEILFKLALNTNQSINQSISENNQIEFEDFRYLMKIIRRDSVRKEDEEKTLQRAFKLFDKDGSGTIDKSELERITTQMGEALSKDELEQMLTLVDTNKDGKIDYNGMIEIFNVDLDYNGMIEIFNVNFG